MVACIHNYLDGRSSIQGQSQRGVSLTLQLSGLDLHTYWKSEQLKMKAIAFSELPPNFTPIGVSPTIWLRIWHAQSMVGVTFVGVRFGECPLQGSVFILDIQILNGWVPLRSFTLLTGIISETPKDPDSKLCITISFIHTFTVPLSRLGEWLSMLPSQPSILIAATWPIKQSQLTNQWIFIN